VDRPVHYLESGPTSSLAALGRLPVPPARVVERAHIVLLVAEGRQDKEMDRILITPKKMSRWR